MKAFGKALLLILWLVVGAHIYMFFWVRNVEYFPVPPKSVEQVLVEVIDWFGPFDTEILTTLYLLLVSFINIGVLTLLAWLIWKLFHKRPSEQ